MSSKNFDHLKTPNNMSKTNFNSKYYNELNTSEKIKNSYSQYPYLSLKKKFNFRRLNLYRSFLNSSAPFNYYKNPADKNTFLICYNGGPQNQIHSFITREDLKQESNNNNKKIIYSLKSCGCPSKQPIRKVSKNLSYIEKNGNYEYNKVNMENNKFNTFKKINYFPKKLLFKKAGNSKGFLTSNRPFMMRKDGNIIRNKEIYNDKNNNYEERKIFSHEKVFGRFKDNNNYENNGKKDIKIIHRANSSLYGFRPRANNIFHKSQIFNHCKPFLVDDFHEFPD